MSKSHPLARARATLTGQSYQHALHSIHRDGLSRRPIPHAEPSQAEIEALALERIGDWAPAVWYPSAPGFGVLWVDPSPTSITIATSYLPDLIRQLTPTISLDGPEPGFLAAGSEVRGVPGLRFRERGRNVVLYRPERQGRIVIRTASNSLWRKAVTIGLDDFGDQVILPWNSHPDGWHPTEELAERHHHRDAADQAAHYRLASDLLRRLPGLCRPFLAHDMWFNFFTGRHDAYQIHFEWQNSGPPNKVLDLLMDADGGLGTTIEPNPLLGQHCDADCYSDTCGYVRLIDPAGCTLHLRHLRYEDPAELPRSWLLSQGSRRHRLELALGYPPSPVGLDRRTAI